MKNLHLPIDESTDLELLTQENLRLRGDLLTVARRITHDLRTPLGCITAACEMVKDASADKDPAVNSLVAPVLTSTDELSRLLERVGVVLKATAQGAAMAPVLMSQPVDSALQRLERRLAAREVSVSQPRDWPEVSGVARWLEIIWWNFLANSLDHGGKAPQIKIGWRKSRGQFCFWVDDDGDGVSASARARLFQPFHTLHEINSTRGLGLSIVQRLMELQGGGWGYEPISGGGARFYFTLPAGSRSSQGA